MSSEQQLRIDLAAAFRWAARLHLHEGIANHFSVATSADGSQFLLNPVGSHFSRIRASDLLLLDSHHAATLDLPSAPDPTAWHLHGQLHRLLPHARCIMHTHMPQATALCCLKDFEWLPLDQNACRFYGRIAYDRNYSGMALDANEGARIASLMQAGAHSVLMMSNHGVIVFAPTVAQALDELYYLEKAATVQLLALSSGQPLALIADALAHKVCQQWNNYPTRFSELHLAAVKNILDLEEPDYQT